MSLDPLKPLLKKLSQGAASVRVEGLKGSSRAYVLARVVKELSKPLLVLAPGAAEARDFAAELRFFLGADQDGEGLPWDRRVVLLPAWDSLPYENLPPHPDVSARRISSLFRALHGGPFVFVAPVESALRLLMPPKALDGHTFTLSVGEVAAREALIEKLLAAGYHRVSQVEERGEVSIRGGLLDIFAPHYPEPLRIEFFDDEIESIRLFDPSTQRSTGKLEEAVILPAREVVGGPAEAEKALAALRTRCHDLGMNLSQTSQALEPLRLSPFAPVRECYLSYFYDPPATIWDYFPKDAPVVLDMVQDLDERLKEFYEELSKGHERAEESGRLVAPVEKVHAEPGKWREELYKHPVMTLGELVTEGGEGGEKFQFFTQTHDTLGSMLKRARTAERLLAPLVDLLGKDRADGKHVYLVCRSPGSAQRLKNLLGEYGLNLGEPEPFIADAERQVGRLSLCLGKLARGFAFPSEGLTLVTDWEIFGQKGKRASAARKGFKSSLSDLSEGGLVVHLDFGIARYRGMVRIKVEEEEGDYLYLEYADGDRLYLPVTRLNLVQRYTAPGDGVVKLDKLGGKGWEKSRKKASEGIEKLAHELLELYAARAVAARAAYPKPDLSYREFEATFPYEETRDQLNAIDEVMADMGRERPMDRLICGDVGYGKTEVAIRAAFRAVEGGKQVAVLAPTTVLAAQHFQNFRKRFEGYPVEVEMLSRFVDKAAQKNAFAKLAQGTADIVVGTHKLMSSELKFKNLGLIVVDEEHRFGVAHKEKLKKFRNNVDVLTLSATPIPRTLQLGLTGARDLSVIETPPADRLAVRTRVARYDDEVIREAVTRELSRGGQVFFVHNRVQSIDEMAAHLKEVIPGIKLGVGHGQMGEDQLKKVMEAFSAGEIDMLVCTAIIESGLDIPRANTIVIDRADTFGLADLYQLRGRVGRSNLQAYCYLLVPEERDMTGDARKRISALQEFSDLGAGFKVAIHDLEIRGAGDFLGKNQSGHIAAIGFDMYADLLDDAVRRLKGEPFGKPPEPDIRLKVPSHFPESYVEEPQLRLELYERLTRVSGPEEIDDLGYELVDRFGPVPEPVTCLMEVMKLRLRLLSLRATGLDYTGENLIISFEDHTPVPPEGMVSIASANPAKCRLTPEGKLRWSIGKADHATILAQAGELLSRLEMLC